MPERGDAKMLIFFFPLIADCDCKSTCILVLSNLRLPCGFSFSCTLLGLHLTVFIAPTVCVCVLRLPYYTYGSSSVQISTLLRERAALRIYEFARLCLHFSLSGCWHHHQFTSAAVPLPPSCVAIFILKSLNLPAA